MKSAVLEEFGQPLVITDVEIGEPGPDEVLVRTAAVGLCHSDLHMMNGAREYPLPAILGHEVSGIIEKVGSAVNGFEVGDHVVGSLSVHCGHCPLCDAGHQVLCGNTDVRKAPGQAQRLWKDETKVSQVFNISGFAEKILVHHSALVSIRKDMPLDRAALLGCAVLTGTGAVFRSAEVQPGSKVVVVGCGGVGLSAINGAAIAGAAQIIAVDPLDDKLAMAKRFGATDVVNAKADNVVEQVCELTGGGVDYAFECIGLEVTTSQCYNMLAPSGLAVVIGLFKPGSVVELPAEGFLSEKRIQGSFMGSNRLSIDIPRLVELYMKGQLKLDDLISKRISLEQINEGFDLMRDGRAARSVVVFPETAPV